MNKYILLLGVAGVALSSYAAIASNSATMNVTATINHDVSLSVTRALNIGTITIDPSYDEGGATINIDGTFYNHDGGIISLSGYTPGQFTANIPGNKIDNTGLDIDTYKQCGDNGFSYMDMDGLKTCFIIQYSGSGSVFNLYADCVFYNSVPSDGVHSGTITIRYTPQ
ncbi:MAG: hypothetical protein IJ689_07630 [Alphaproteobacteria bacterium]|nr:hypothetical protein [Alphaproteobacteria bacterium]